MKKGVIAFDIDGTLTHRIDGIDPKIVETLESLEKDGWHIALITGRMFSFAGKILQHFKFPYLLAVQNGADILEMPAKKLLKRNYLPSQVIPKIEEAYQDIQEDFLIYSGIDQGDFCYFRPQKYSKKALNYLKILESYGKSPWKESDFCFQEADCFSLVKCFGAKEAMEHVQKRLKQDEGIEISMIRDPIDPIFYLNLITHPHANKGHAVQFLRQHFQASTVIAAGDDCNDLKMLQAADISIAMETAPEEVLACADVHAKPARELGIIQAVHEAIHLLK